MWVRSAGAERMTMQGVRVVDAERDARLAHPWIALQRWWQAWSKALRRRTSKH
jgi:hypothetical protein